MIRASKATSPQMPETMVGVAQFLVERPLCKRLVEGPTPSAHPTTLFRILKAVKEKQSNGN